MKRRLPQRPEAVDGIEGGETGIFGIDEDDVSALADGNLVDVEVAGGLRVARHVEPVELLVGHLTLREHVLQTPDLGDGREVDALGVGAEAHGAHEVALIDRQASSRQSADQHQLSGLIGGERQADAVRGEPVDKTTRGADFGGFSSGFASRALAARVSFALGRRGRRTSLGPRWPATGLGLLFAGGSRLGRRRQRVTSENAGAKADRTEFSPLPLVAHADLAAYAVDIVAKGDIDLAEA